MLEQNSIYSKKEIDNIIRDLTGFIPITIEKNKCDVANYPSFPFLKDDIDFINHLDEELKSVSIKRITLFDRPIDEVAICGYGYKNTKPCFYSARGNYLNFIRINNTIILPEYNLSSKKETAYNNKTNQEILEGLGFEVLRINCDRLAKFGDVLHCISLTA